MQKWHKLQWWRKVGRELEITTMLTPEGHFRIPHIEWRLANLGPSLSSERHQLGIQIRVEFGRHDCGIRNNKNPLSRIRNSSDGNPACATVYQSRCCLVTMATSTLNTFVSVLRSNSRRMTESKGRLSMYPAVIWGPTKFSSLVSEVV